jgi:hypothetical protein
MPSLVFPVFSDGTQPDSSKYSIEVEDPAVRTEMEGGYVYTRPRHTRRPRRTFKIGYTYVVDEVKDGILDLWDAASGGSVIFSWLNHEDGITYDVRFKAKPTIQYRGRLDNRRWDCSFDVEEA